MGLIKNVEVHEYLQFLLKNEQLGNYVMTDQALQTKILEKSMLNTYTQQFNVVIDANLCLSLDEKYSFSPDDLIINM